MRLAKLTLLVASLPLVGACSSITGTDAKKVADAIGTISPSRKDTCETLRQIAQQTSKIETIRQGKEVVIASPKCADAKS